MEKTVVARWVRPLEVPEASQDVEFFWSLKNILNI